MLRADLDEQALTWRWQALTGADIA